MKQLGLHILSQWSKARHIRRNPLSYLGRFGTAVMPTALPESGQTFATRASHSHSNWIDSEAVGQEASQVQSFRHLDRLVNSGHLRLPIGNER
jgi:hypothetical protein